MSLVDDKHVPIRLKYLDILIKLSAHHRCSSQVLHRRKIYITVPLACKAFEGVEVLTFGARTVMIFGLVEEYLLKVLKPSLIHYRTMGEDERALCIHFPNHLQCAQCLAKSHLGIPQHLVASLESL